MNSTTYALFDPHSAFNNLRASLLPREKIRGYFYWRQTCRKWGEEQKGPSVSRPPLVFCGGAPPKQLNARVTIPREDPLPDHYTIEVTFLEPIDLPFGGVPCRAFIVEQGVLDRLRARCAPLDGQDELAIAQLLDHRLLSDNFAAQQAVAALPELEGHLTGNQLVLEAAIPPGSPNISDRAWVVVVIDAPLT